MPRLYDIDSVQATRLNGAGLTRAFQDAGIKVAEVNRPDRAARRRQGKSDPLDAYAAAPMALAGHGPKVPKDEHTDAVRALLIARRGAVKAHTAAINQIKALLVTAQAELRERYRRHTSTQLIAALARWRPCAQSDPTSVAVLAGCKALAQRAEFLKRQEKDLTTELDTRTHRRVHEQQCRHGWLGSIGWSEPAGRWFLTGSHRTCAIELRWRPPGVWRGGGGSQWALLVLHGIACWTPRPCGTGRTPPSAT
jgi:hypothetical protein